MGQAKHTPGPWDYDIILDICTESEDLSEGFKQGIAEANARLITAAPKMLEALHTALGCLDFSENPSTEAVIREAIQKAEGL